jgi:rhombotail lipoprotein
MSSRALRRSASVMLAALLSACTIGRSHQSTSVVGYLYPEGRAAVIDTTAIPVLKLPLRVGIAFVPPAGRATRYGDVVWTADGGIPEAEKLRLMRRVTDHFRKQAIIKSVEVIPTTYLTPGGGFANLDQLRAMFDVDVVVLLAYDQVQFTTEGAASLSYLTLVGAFVVEGEKHDTRTMLDAVVIDVASRRVLFRAPGTSVLKAHSTAIELDEVQRENQLKGFILASENLVGNLETSLDQFKARVREAPEDVKVVRTAEFDRRAAVSGAGAVDRSLLLLVGLATLIAMLGGGLFRRDRR